VRSFAVPALNPIPERPLSAGAVKQRRPASVFMGQMLANADLIREPWFEFMPGSHLSWCETSLPVSSRRIAQVAQTRRVLVRLARLRFESPMAGNGSLSRLRATVSEGHFWHAHYLTARFTPPPGALPDSKIPVREWRFCWASDVTDAHLPLTAPISRASLLLHLCPFLHREP
jgi:hypothetical protein